MQPSELRLGNRIDFDAYRGGEIHSRWTNGEVTGIAKDYVYINEIKIPELKALRPIPLTPEWLDNFVFFRRFFAGKIRTNGSGQLR